MTIVDTGVLLGAADADDQDHDRCAAVLRERQGELQVPSPVIVETAWQIERNLGPTAESRFLRVITAGQFEVIDLTIGDYARCAELIDLYADLRLGFVASVATIAERLRISAIATLNRRDFTVVRPRHIEAFELLP